MLHGRSLGCHSTKVSKDLPTLLAVSRGWRDRVLSKTVHAVFGSGTNLDSSRLKHLIAKDAGVGELSVHIHVIGEHGDSSVACFSSGTISGIPIDKYLLAKHPERTPDDMLKVKKEMHRNVIGSAAEVISLKGYTSWVGVSKHAMLGFDVLQAREVSVVAYFPAEWLLAPRLWGTPWPTSCITLGTTARTSSL